MTVEQHQEYSQVSNERLNLIKSSNDDKSFRELIKILDVLNSEKLIAGLGDIGDDKKREMVGEMYGDFEKDVIKIIKDGLISKVELYRLESINNIIDGIMETSYIMMDLDHKLSSNNIKIPEINSIKELVYSRNILDGISEDTDSIEGLKMILGLIENVGTSNITDVDLKEINSLISDIFDGKLEKNDIAKLSKLQTMLILTYNVEQKQKYNNFSLDDSDLEGLNQNEVKTTESILDVIADLDQYGDLYNEISPTIGNFMDSIAVEVKKGLIDGEKNTLGASLRIIVNKFINIRNNFKSIDFSDPLGSRNQILRFAKDIYGFDKDPLMLHAINTLRFIIPKSLNLLFTGVKELKNYYIGTTGPETEHGIFLQKIHGYRNEIKDGNYSFDWLKNISGRGAEVADSTITNGLSIFNGGTDAVLDFSGVLLNTLFLPEKTIAKVKDFISSIDFNGNSIMEEIKGMIPKNVSNEVINKILYVSSYILMYTFATSLIPGLGTINNNINKLLSNLSEMIGKPVEKLTSLIKKGIGQINKTKRFRDISKITKNVLNKVDKTGGHLNKVNQINNPGFNSTQTKVNNKINVA